MLKSSILDVCPQEYMKVKIDSDDDLPLEKILNMHTVVILIKSAFHENHNFHYHQMFLEK